MSWGEVASNVPGRLRDRPMHRLVTQLDANFSTIAIDEVAANEREAVRREARKVAEGKAIIAAIGILRPDLEVAYICGDAPIVRA